MKNVIFIMGICGTGKTSVGVELSKILNVKFLEGDNFHTKESIIKMSNG